MVSSALQSRRQSRRSSASGEWVGVGPTGGSPRYSETCYSLRTTAVEYHFLILPSLPDFLHVVKSPITYRQKEPVMFQAALTGGKLPESVSGRARRSNGSQPTRATQSVNEVGFRKL